MVNRDRFIQDVKIGNTIWIQPAIRFPSRDGIIELESVVVKDILNEGIYILRPDSDWSDRPVWYDFTKIDQYYVLDESEREAPFMEEINNICKAFETMPAPHILPKNIFKELNQGNDAAIVRRAESIWASSEKANDAYSIDENERKCARAINELGYERVFIILRGYNRYKYGCIKNDSQRIDAALSDFVEAEYWRGAYFCKQNAAIESTDLLKKCLYSEKIIDESVLIALLNRLSYDQKKENLSHLFHHFNDTISLETLYKATISIVCGVKNNQFRLPDETSLFSSANTSYIMSFLPEVDENNSQHTIGDNRRDNKGQMEEDEKRDSKEKEINTAVVDSDPNHVFPRSEPYTGSVISVSSNMVGFIKLDSDCNFLSEGDLFFHISYVKNDNLRKKLCIDSNNGGRSYKFGELRVCFRLFKNTYSRDEGLCAGELEWTNEPTNTVSMSKTPVKGDITSFSSISRYGDSVNKGWITAQKHKYGFSLTDCDDPILRIFLRDFWGNYGGDEPLQVWFYSLGDKAIHLSRVEKELPRNLLQDIITEITNDEKDKWLNPSIPTIVPEEPKDIAPTYAWNYRQLTELWTDKLPKTTRRIQPPRVVAGPPKESMAARVESTLEERHLSFKEIIHQEPYEEGQTDLFLEIKQKTGAEATTDEYRNKCFKLLRNANSQEIVTPTAGFLFQYYIQTNDYQSAIDLLDAIEDDLNSDDIIHRRIWFSREKYLNRRIMALEKAKSNGETRYLDELYDLYKQKQLSSTSITQKYHFQYQRAYIRYLQNRYLDAIQDFNECIDMIDDNQALGASQKDTLTCKLWITIADCYLAIGNTTKAKEYANRVLRPSYRTIDGISEIQDQAQIILSGNRLQINTNPIESNEGSMLQTKKASSDIIINYDEEDYPAYVNYLLSNFRLSSIFEGSNLRKIAENQSYIGNASAKAKLVKYLREGLSNDKTNANTLNSDLAMAMFIVLRTNNAKKISDQEKQEAIFMLGNCLRYKADELVRTGKGDAAEYLYILASLYAKDKEYSNCLRRATGSVFIDYLQSGRGGIYPDLSSERMEYISRFYRRSVDQDSIEYVNSEHIISKCIRNFICIFEIARPNPGQSDSQKREYLKEYIRTVSETLRLWLFRDGDGLFKQAFLEAGKIDQVQFDATIEDPTGSFVQLVESAIQRWDACRRDFERRLLTSTGSAMIATLEFENREQLRRFINTIQEHEVYHIYEKAKSIDAIYIDELISIIHVWFTYFDQKSFSERIAILNQIADRSETLKCNIIDNPTSVSYELILPNVEAILVNVYDTMDALYRIEPQLELSVLDDNAAVNGKENIRFDIVLSNGDEDRQSVTISKVEVFSENSEINVHNNSFTNRFNNVIGGGKSVSYEVNADVSDSVFQEAYFSLDVIVVYEYQYAHGVQKQKSKEQQLRAIVNLRKVSFTPIDNPYDAMSFKQKTLVERTDILSSLQKNIQGSDRSGAVLWGQKRIGKTVILNNLKRVCPTWNTDKVKYIYVETEMMETRSSNPLEDPYKDVLRNILREMARSIAGKGKPEYYAYPELKELIVYLKNCADRMESSSNPRQLFLDTLGECGEMIDDITQDNTSTYHLVIAIDEFTACLEMFERKKIESEDLIFWKKLVEFNNLPVHLILVAHDNWKDLLGKSINALSVFEPIPVSYMTEQEAEQLVLKHMTILNEDGTEESRFRNNCYKRILELTARSPFLIQEVCKQLVNYMNDEEMVYIVREQLEKFLSQRVTGENGRGLDASFFDPQLSPRRSGDTGEQNRILLQAFARASSNPESDWISLRSINIQMPDEVVNTLLDNLDQNHRDIVERKREDNNDQFIRFKVPLLGAWLKYRV